MTEIIVRESTAGQVRRILAERILSGDLAPGARLRELHIASELKVSQGPVREALRELEAQGLVHTEPYKGATVREVTKADLREAYIVRASLEELAGRLAAPKFKGDVEALRRFASAVRDAAQKDDISAYVAFDVAFHRAIIEAAGNRILLRSWDSLGFEVRMQMRLANHALDLAEAQKEHWPIVDALAAGDGRTAGKLLQRHVSRFADLDALAKSQAKHSD